MTRDEIVEAMAQTFADRAGLPAGRALREGAAEALAVIEREFQRRALRETPDHSPPVGRLPHAK